MFKFIEETATDQDMFWIKILLLMIPSFFILIRATKDLYFKKYTLTKRSLIVKSYLKIIELELDELKEASLTMPPIDKKGYVIISSKNYLIRIPYVQAMGGIDFLMKLKTLVNIPMIDEERLKKNVNAFRPVTLKEDRIEYKRRKAVGMKVI